MTSNQSMKMVSNLCRKIPSCKILSGAAYGARANIYNPQSIADLELSTPQCLLLALLHSLVTGDMASCVMLADICHQVVRLRSRHLRVWLMEDFSFPQTDIEEAMALLVQLVTDGTLKLPGCVLTIMTALAKRYKVPGVHLRTLTEEGRCYLMTELENAVVNNNPKDIFDLVSEGADVSGSTQSGDSFLHLAARAGSSATISALVFLNADLEAVNSSNATPLEVAVRHNSTSSVGALLIAGAKYDKRLSGGDTYLHVAAAGVFNETLELLLNWKMDINSKNQLCETPLLKAVRAGNIQGIELLLKKGVELSVLSGFKLKDGDNIVHTVARSGNVEILEILEDRKVPANIKNNNGLTPLHVACNTSIVRILLRMGVPVDSQDNAGSTPLMLASRNSKADIVTLLLLNRADPMLKNKEGRTALHYAAEGGCVGLMTSLLDVGASMCEQDNNGYTPIFLADVNNKTEILHLLAKRAALSLRDSNSDTLLHKEARSGHVDVVRALLLAGAAVDMKGYYQKTALHLAAKNGHTALVTALLDAGAAVDMMGNDQKTALHLAAENGHTAVATVLLAASAAVDMMGNDQKTALHLAAENGHTAVVTALLGASAAVDMKENSQKTALHLAAQNGHTAVVTALLGASAAVDMKEKSQKTALHLAAQNGHTAVVTALLGARAAVDMKGQCQQTALHLAAQNGHTAVVTALLAARAAVDMKDSCQQTALHLAAQNGHTAVVTALLGARAAVDMKEYKQKTALYLAVEKGHTPVVTALLKAGADLGASTDDGVTPLIHASRYGHLAVVEVLIGRCAINARDNSKWTALHWANYNKHRAVADYLRSRGGVE